MGPPRPRRPGRSSVQEPPCPLPCSAAYCRSCSSPAWAPRRWQAHYDYALAQLQCRLAFLNEYDLALGNVRTDVLPDLDAAKGHNGFRLVPAEKMRSRKDVAQLAEDAHERFAKVAADH